MPRISIRINILTNFLLLISITVALLLGLQYYYANQLAVNAVTKTFKQVASNVITFTNNSENYTKRTLSLLSINSEVYAQLHLKEKHPILNDFVQVMHKSPNINAMYVAHPNGDFYEVFNLKNMPQLRQEYHLDDNTSQWAVFKTTHKNSTYTSNICFLSQNLEPIFEKEVDIKYDINSRVWYKAALLSNKVIRTKPYLFASQKEQGITYAKEVGDTKIVVGLDFTLKNLDNFLKSQNFDVDSHLVLYLNNGEAIASSQEHSLTSWPSVYQSFQKGVKQENGLYHEGEQTFFVYHDLVNNQSDSTIHLAIILPKENLLKPYTEKIMFGIYAAIVFVLLTIPFVFISTSYITKPIYALMKENDKISQRHFAKVQPVSTNIIELHNLSVSQVTMSQEIQEYQKAQEELLDSIIYLIADAIDAKSAYTGGHCSRVPVIAKSLLEAASKDTLNFKDFDFEGKDAWREFEIGSWLHDCGKLTTPEFVVDKATKLETINDRIHEIRTRFEVLWRDTQIRYLELQLQGSSKEDALKQMQKQQAQLLDDFAFIAASNVGGEYMSPDKQARINAIGAQEWLRHFDATLGLGEEEKRRLSPTAKRLPVTEKLLSDKPEHIIVRDAFDFDAYTKQGFKEEVPQHLYNKGELYNLCIAKGTLTPEERYKINEHVIMSIKMLENIPFPEHLSRVPEYAGTHHETLIGTGYPRQLCKEELSIPSRIMAIADIFEALTASDRPYKKAKTLSESLKIMSFMVKDQHIDAKLFELFLRSGAYIEYAEDNLKPEQIDAINIKEYLT